MNATSIKFKNHPCFKNSWAGFDEIRPVNVIIGRNNTGKSRLLDLVEALCRDSISKQPWEINFKTIFDADSLQKGFQSNVSEGPLPGNHWANHGKFFIGKKATIQMQTGAVTSVALEAPDDLKLGLPIDRRMDHVVAARNDALKGVARLVIPPLRGREFIRLSAERNIGTEIADPTLNLGPDGHGATNIIRRYLTSSSFPRELIQRDLLNALNEVFGEDGRFTEIETRLHDKAQEPDQSENHWEVYLAEEKKGLVALSRSGSGLKTVLLVLLNLIVVPAFQAKKTHSYAFAFEELETHLHPTLLRRLLLYIEKFVREKEAIAFLTTHSSVALDLFGLSTDAQIIHVQHDGESATAATVTAHFDRVGIVAELGVKPSDLLHANGIIWIEGPSDRVYINRWIDLVSNGELKEGRDYTCAMYGGALLARAQLVAPEQVDVELINLLSINSNIVVVCDSDRTAAEGEG
ncbi:MAG: AAA family ATPase, partial [Verrucomicrobia bacterium]|nr:AAA family ATPase [Verrucomicrobiota bacterium]